MRGLLIVARRQAASLRRSLPDSPLRGLYGALPCTSVRQHACTQLGYSSGGKRSFSQPMLVGL